MRHKLVLVAVEHIQGLLSAEPVRPGIVSDFPENTKIVGCYMYDQRTIALRVENESFPSLEPGDDPPLLTVVFRCTLQDQPWHAA